MKERQQFHGLMCAVHEDLHDLGVSDEVIIENIRTLRFIQKHFDILGSISYLEDELSQGRYGTDRAGFREFLRTSLIDSFIWDDTYQQQAVVECGMDYQDIEPIFSDNLQEG